MGGLISTDDNDDDDDDDSSSVASWGSIKPFRAIKRYKKESRLDTMIAPVTTLPPEPTRAAGTQAKVTMKKEKRKKKKRRSEKCEEVDHRTKRHSKTKTQSGDGQNKEENKEQQDKDVEIPAEKNKAENQPEPLKRNSISTRLDYIELVSELANALNGRVKEREKTEAESASGDVGYCSEEFLEELPDDLSVRANWSGGSSRESIMSSRKTSVSSLLSYRGLKNMFERLQHPQEEDEDEARTMFRNREEYRHLEELGLGFWSEGKWIPTDVIAPTIWKKVESTVGDGCQAYWKRSPSRSLKQLKEERA